MNKWEVEMKKLWLVLFIIAVFVGWGLSGLRAQQNQGKVNPQVKEFMEKAATDGMFEVESGKLALQMSKNETVKQFAQKMIHDHSQANQQLMEIVRKEGVNLPPQMNQEQQKLYDNLKNAKNFDQEYADTMVQDHKKAVSDFEKEKSKVTDNPEMKKFVDETLPILKQHLNLAEEMQKKVF
jgi:putative membrane protein